MMDEQRFSALHGDNASRQNAPVNVVVGALMMKEPSDYTDDECAGSLMLDVRLQYVLNATSFAEQPLSDKAISSFRRRCRGYELATGVRRKSVEEGGTPGSRMLQDPSGPDAAHRVEAGKRRRGYVANMEESVGGAGSVVTNYHYDVNACSGSGFFREPVEEVEWIEGTALVADGDCEGAGNATIAEEKGIDLVATVLVGKDPEDALADVERPEGGKSRFPAPSGACPASAATSSRPSRQTSPLTPRPAGRARSGGSAGRR